MKGGVGPEQIDQQLATEQGINGDPWIEKVFRPQITAEVEHDQGSTPLLRQASGRFGDLGNGAGPGAEFTLGVADQHSQSTGAEQLHQSPQFPLPEDGQGEGAGQNEGIDQLGGQGQIGVALHKPRQGHQKEVAPQQPQRPGFIDPGKQQEADR